MRSRVMIVAQTLMFELIPKAPNGIDCDAQTLNAVNAVLIPKGSCAI